MLFAGRTSDGVSSLEADGCCQSCCSIASCGIFFFELTSWKRSVFGRLAAFTASMFCIRRAMFASRELFRICSVRSVRIWRFVTVSVAVLADGGRRRPRFAFRVVGCMSAWSLFFLPALLGDGSSSAALSACARLHVSDRTLRCWWQEFSASRFWRAHRGRLAPGKAARLPGDLVARFPRGGLVARGVPALRFLREA